MIQKIKHLLYTYFLNRKLKKSTYVKKPVSFRDAKTIGILFDGRSEDYYSAISRYVKKLTKQGKKVDVLVYVDKVTEDNDIEYTLISKKDFNWYQHPKGLVIKDFVKNHYDILLNLSLSSNGGLEYISAMTQAHLKIGKGPESNKHLYDLMVDTSIDSNISTFIGQVDYFLKIVNKDG